MLKTKSVYADKNGIHMEESKKTPHRSRFLHNLVLEVNITILTYHHFPKLASGIEEHLKYVADALYAVVRATTNRETTVDFPRNMFYKHEISPVVTEVTAYILLPYTSAPTVKSLLDSFQLYHIAETGFTFQYEIDNFPVDDYDVRVEERLSREACNAKEY